MSTNSECQFFSHQGNHYYLIEDAYAGESFDWREDADCVGPFASEEDAEDHLHRNYANPGGSFHLGEVDEPDSVLKRKMARASNPRRR